MFEEGSWTIYRLPADHWHCQLSNFDWGVHPGLEAAVRQFVAQIDLGEAPKMLLTGPPGVGKTHLTVGLYRLMAKRFGTSDSYWCEVPVLYDQVKAGIDRGDRPMEELQQARKFVALDDLYGRDPSPWEVSNILVPAINYAQRNKVALVASTNYSIQQLNQRLNPHELDRLTARALVVQIKGASRR